MDETEKAILGKLYFHRCIGGRHTSIDDAVKGLPKHLRGEATKAVKKLVKQGWLIQHPTSYGPQIAINPRRIVELRKLLGEEG